MVADDSLRSRLLDGRFIAALASEEPDGSSYLTAIWYRYADGAFYFPTARGSRKARNVAARPRAAVMIDSRSEGKLAGVAAAGPAEVIGGEEARRLNAQIHRRYLTSEGLRDPALGGLLAASDDATIRLRPERWRSWDLAAVFGERLGSARLTYPLDG